MGKITQYRPAFFEGFKNETADFKTTSELLNIPFVKNFKNQHFSGYAISSSNILMAIYEDGKVWWVVGTIDDITAVNLPKWVSGEKS